MSFFEAIGSTPAQRPVAPQIPQQGQLPMTREQMMQMQQQMLSDVKKDPHGAIKNAGYKIPDNINDPMDMSRYLLDSGQITGPLAQMARQLMARMPR